MITDGTMAGSSDGGKNTRSGRHGNSNAANDAESKISKLGHLTQEKLSDAASYVRDRGVDGLRTDLTDAATRSPLRAIAMSLGIGYVIGRIMSRR